MPDNRSAAVTETAFECPFCGAYTTQTWFAVYGVEIDGKERTPRIPASDAVEILQRQSREPENKADVIAYVKQLLSGRVFFRKVHQIYPSVCAENLFLSECYNCQKIAVWVHTSLVSPPQRFGPAPNPDLPNEIAIDFEEARAVVNLSPRGAAALLRLCIQKLCIFLGQPGKKLDDDIATLVAAGLNPLVQKSLDVVRVIGNEAVHPGNLDLKDDINTATRLFELVNAVADQMISQPNRINELYKKLPEEKRKAIEKRDRKSK
jgi:hypothetical protein